MNKYALRRVIVLLTIALLCARAADVVVRLVREQESQTYLPSINVPLPLVPVRTTKKGIGLAYPNFADDARNAGASWCYNWSPGGSCGDDSIEFVAMVWGRSIPAILPVSVKWLLGANEPDVETQANVTPEAYVEIWREIEGRFGDKYLAAPVPSQLDQTWIVRFRDAYIAHYGYPPRLDALTLHCYVATADHCWVYVSWIIDRAREWNIGEVWLTEFGVWKCLNTAGYLSEIRKLIERMEDEPMVARYAIHTNRTTMLEWWMYGLSPDCNPSLFDFETGARTLIGEVYARAQ
jgi:hypothetical protein